MRSLLLGQIDQWVILTRPNCLFTACILWRLPLILLGRGPQLDLGKIFQLAFNIMPQLRVNSWLTFFLLRLLTFVLASLGLLCLNT